jgi:hypothetical protein
MAEAAETTVRGRFDRSVFDEMLEHRELAPERVVERRIEREQVRPLGASRVEPYPDSERRA